MRATNYDEVISGALLNPDERFEQAIDMARDGLTELHADGHITGAMIYGSAVSRDDEGNTDRDPLSDIDILVVTPNDEYHAERRLRGLALAVRRNTAVAPELGWMTEHDARNGSHNLLPTTLSWLGRQAVHYPEMTVGTTPSDLIEPNDENVLGIVSTWFRVTRNNLMKAGNSADAQVAFGLSVPHLAARKSIDALRFCDPDDVLGVPPPQSHNYTKSEVADMARVVYGRRDQRLWETYEEFGLIKQFFLGFLDDVATRNIASRQGYDATMDDLAADIVPKASDLLLRMQTQFDALAEQLSGTQPERVSADRLLPEPPGELRGTSSGQLVDDVGVYRYGFQMVSNY